MKDTKLIDSLFAFAFGVAALALVYGVQRLGDFGFAVHFGLGTFAFMAAGALASTFQLSIPRAAFLAALAPALSIAVPPIVISPMVIGITAWFVLVSVSGTVISRRAGVDAVVVATGITSVIGTGIGFVLA